MLLQSATSKNSAVNIFSCIGHGQVSRVNLFRLQLSLKVQAVGMPFLRRPGNLQVVSTAQTSINLSWDAATDNVGITGYDVYVNNVKSTTVTGTTATVAGLTAATTYSFTVLARDAAGNTSGFSNAVSGTTGAGNLPLHPEAMA